MLKISEIRNMTKKELYDKIDSLKAELLALRFQSATGQLENPNQISNTKRSIARVYTVIFEKNHGITVEPKKIEVSKEKTKNTKVKSEEKDDVKKTTSSKEKPLSKDLSKKNSSLLNKSPKKTKGGKK